MYLAKFSDKLMHICDNIFNSNHATCHICWQKLLLSLSLLLLLLLWSGVSLKIRQKLICCIICCIIIMMIIAVLLLLLLLLLSALSVTRQGPKLSFVPRQMRNNSLKCK